ncbi:MAG TPA: cation transporting ATPase C-terminal domain-containing protein [Gaiellaceae bacterium]|nr:cation transporting ATPase C-terminal domain-containing protein [Gaiellaceae bacterium]
MPLPMEPVQVNCRSLRHSMLTIGFWSTGTVYLVIGTVVVLQLGLVDLPFVNELFGSAPLAGEKWLVVLPVVSIEKRARTQSSIARARDT